MNGDLLSNRKRDFCRLRNMALGCIVASAVAVSIGQTTGTASVVGVGEQGARETSGSKLAVSPASFDDAASTETRMYRLDIRLFSIIPESGFSSYRGAKGLSVITGTGGMVGPAYSDDERQFGVHIWPQLISGKFSAAVKLIPWSADSVIQERSFDVDLSSLDAKTVELGRAPDGRVYKLSFVPGIEITLPDKTLPITNAFKQIEEMRFSDSVVTLNDDSYLGSILGLNGAERAYVDIPALFKVDFSLVQVRGYEKMGLLKDGRIKLEIPNGDTLEISNVSSGAGSQLRGGPYEVWGKWTPAKETTEEAIAKGLAEYEKEKSAGNPEFDTPKVQEILERLKRGKFRMTYGAAGLTDSERVIKR